MASFPSYWTGLLLVSIVAHVSSLLLQPQQPLYSKSWTGPSSVWNDPVMITHSLHLIQSHYNLCKRELVPLKLVETDPNEAARLLYFREDLVVLSHGLQDGKEGPILNYANIAAQNRWYDHHFIQEYR